MKRILIAAIILLAVSVQAGTVTYPFIYSGSGCDSIRTIVYYRTSAKVDSLKATSFPYSGTITLQDSCGFVVEERYYYTSMASATIKYVNAMSEIYPRMSTDAATKVWAATTRTITDSTNLSKIATDAAAKTWATATRTLSDTTNISKVATDAAAKVWATGTKAVTSVPNVTVAGFAANADSVNIKYANMGRIADTIWEAAHQTTRALKGTQTVTVPTVTTVTNQLTAAQVAEGVWGKRADSAYASGSWGDTLKDWYGLINDSVWAGPATRALAGTQTVTIPTVTTVTNQLTGAAIATAVWDKDTTGAGYASGTKMGYVAGRTGSSTGLDSIQTWVIANSAAKRAILKDTTKPILADGSGYVTLGAYKGGEDPATYILTTPANKIATDGSGQVSVGSNVDKTGYSLTATERANLADSVWGAGAGGHLTTRALKGSQSGVTIPTVTDLTNWQKTGYSLSSSQTFNNTGTWTGNLSGSVGSVTGNVGGNVAGSVASVTGNVGGNVTGSVGSVASGGIDSLAFTAASKHMIAKHSDSGTVAVIDSAALSGVTLVATVPDSLWTKLGALYSKEFGSGLMHVKYISAGGDNSDGSTWKKAYTTPNKIAVGDSNTIFMVDKGLFDTVHVNILARNVAILANAGGGVVFQNDSIARGTAQKDAINVYKPNFYINGVEFIGHTFSLGDEDSLALRPIRNPWPNAITIYGTGHNATIENCYFGPRNYKSIVTIDSVETGKCDTARAPMNLTIRNNVFRNNQMFSMDVNPNGGLIEGNRIIGIESNPVNGAAAIQLFTKSRNVLITNNFFDSVGIAVACQNDTNTVVSKNIYGYMIPGYGRFTSSGSVHRTTDEPDLYRYADVKPDGTNWLTDPGMEQFHVDVRNPDPWVVYLSKGSTPPDTSFPDARVVQTTVHSGNWSWYAACTQATVQQATLVQTLRLDSASYVISCMAYGNAGGVVQIKAVPLSGTLADSSYHVFTIDSANTWRPLVMRFNHTNSGMVKVEYIVHSYPSVTTAYLDDFSVTKEPYVSSSGGGSTTVVLAPADLDTIVAGVLRGMGGVSGGGVPVTVSGNSYTTIGSLRVAIREATQIYDQSLMPDSVINDAAVRAAVGVSTDIGGYEASLSFQTVPGVSRYPLSDTIINVIYGWVKSGQGSVYALKSWYPQFFDDFKLPTLSGENTDQETPVCYRLWADSVELLPTPSKVDTVKMDVLVQHPFVSVLPGQDGLKLRPTFFDAVLYRACRDLMVGIDLTEKANAFGGLYEAKKKELLEAYARRLDVRGTK